MKHALNQVRHKSIFPLDLPQNTGNTKFSRGGMKSLGINN